MLVIPSPKTPHKGQNKGHKKHKGRGQPPVRPGHGHGPGSQSIGGNNIGGLNFNGLGIGGFGGGFGGKPGFGFM
jgi:hypothetical protein